MEPLFVTECKFDNKSYYEMVPILRKKPSRNFLIFTPVIILIMIFFLVLWGMSGFRDFSWLIPLPAVVYISYVSLWNHGCAPVLH